MKILPDLAQDQVDAINFIDEGEDTLLCADIGTGKTVISLTAAQNALNSQEVTRWLVLAPLLVATDTWSQEYTEWSHLQDLNVAIACGTEEQRIKAIESTAEIVVLNYENLSWLMDRYPKPRRGKPDPFPFDGLILDEVDKLKEVSSGRFKAFRNRIEVFKKRIGMTGTILPNKLTELWGQVYMVDGGETFGRSFYKWREEFFYPIDYNRYKWRALPDTRDTLIKSLQGLVYRLPAKGLPEVVLCEPHIMTLPDYTREIYDRLEKDFYLALEDEQKDKREVNSANSAVLAGHLQQISAGFSYVPPKRHEGCGGTPYKTERKGYKCRRCGKTVPKDAIWHSKDRFDWYQDLWAELFGDQVLIFYHFTEELRELQRRFPDLLYLGSGVNNTNARQAIQKWNAGEISHLALHPASAGHGLNLQKSGAHHIAFLTMPWSGGMFKQVVGRLARRGQKAEKIYVHTALFKDTIDEQVYASLQHKNTELESFLNALEEIAA